MRWGGELESAGVCLLFFLPLRAHISAHAPCMAYSCLERPNISIAPTREQKQKQDQAKQTRLMPHLACFSLISVHSSPCRCRPGAKETGCMRPNFGGPLSVQPAPAPITRAAYSLAPAPPTEQSDCPTSHHHSQKGVVGGKTRAMHRQSLGKAWKKQKR